MSLEPIALTTPLFYVNDRPHIGSAYPTIAADAFARFYRLKGHPVMFVTGTDEHGQKIQRTAEKNNLSPQDHCDRTVAEFYTLWERLNIRFDRFTRTTAPKHQAIVNEFFQRVYDSGDIYLNQQKGWYCVACEEFKEERELPTSHHCPIHTNVVCEWRDEPNYFFRLSKYQDALIQFHETNLDFIQPESRRNEVLGFMKQGLQDFSISRVNLDWGFPIPIDPTHTIYVWFDALLGYVTALLDPDDEPTLENALKKWYPFNLHIIGKDILRFHAIYWPAMLMSAGLALPNRIFGHGLLTKDGLKMGKTLGNTIDPYDLVDRFGADAIRYYFLKEIEFGKDGDFSEERFISIVNADLANSLGNLLNRSLGMVNKYCQGTIPAIDPSDPSEVSNLIKPVIEQASNLGDRVASDYQNLNFRAACEKILELIWNCNKLIDETTPWKQFKAGKQKEVNETLYALLESVRIAAYLIAPITSNLSIAAYQQLGLSFDEANPPDWSHTNWGILQSGQMLGIPTPIFQRIENTKV
ncbi:MAG: methionine--tRNA ligase [Pseudanabaena sp. M090S1SP1A06QC]|jgi:methionyl-tRNA synthetase|nr:methionine--tRNA ligase [Pseudanabaena sp. M051S1SP1A06QC]MCA6588918.1 methionine--tRNA ligase [Pseudanabaena sp. M109S1SP1A06QC]MCA6606508.1 methionine--tRNA ligase [Pseudanabaena sp. M007S1SP1A06QC]MCA6613802.1 methionine--tRNA ligase [Pseudanabaena sp. M090S1SP1A06QC]MCA6624062.1 methionine--tRNA ligase [Pseudanabaena sp. M165S2SP1A06QC]